MKRVRAFIRWMKVDPRHPDIARAQYNELKTQIPSLYALLMVNAVAVSYTHYDVAPFYLTVGALAAILVISAVRLVAWIKVRHLDPAPAEAVRRLRRTIVIGGLIAAIYITWSLSLDTYGGPEERGHIALFIAITVIGCIFCLTNLPQAAVLVMAVVTIPYLVYYLRQDNDVYTAIAMNIFLVCVVVLQVVFRNHRSFCKLVRSQAETEVLNAENERLAQTDALTNLPNRRYFFSQLETRIGKAKAEQSTIAVGVVDLDRFKQINDTYGHQLGDQLLGEVGKRLNTLSLPDVVICRLGGDEFGFLCPGDPNEATKTGDRICELLSAPYQIGDLQVSVGASCGLALYPQAGTTAQVLFGRSDYALYHAKTNSRGRSTIYSAAHEALMRSEQAVETALQRANLEEEFEVHFQPVVSLPDRTIIGFEALARWHSPSLGEVRPDRFIPIAERTGFVHNLTPFLFAKALKQIKALPGDLCLAFNLSGHDITSPDTVDTLLEIIRSHELPPQMVTFEITETAVISSYDAAEKSLRKLKTAGAKTALDDFGTGYSSLGYLHRLPIDCVKIDRSFLAGIEDPADEGVVRSIIEMCRSLQMLCVVEGVETRGQLDLVEKLQCRLVQGDLFSGALSYDVIRESVDKTDKVAGLPLSVSTQLDALKLSAS
ncbi:putative bifunctional diguanylate cyclase/phosphodiesterase [Roseibium sp.]|uniref:putative bifunctional diguanylate cyclase/phosphodiesterase n=1 Tax=Roseibium sp. TaxID=1936156 RepID=UPI003D0B80CF